MTIPVRLDEDGDLWYARQGEENNYLTGHLLNYTSLEPIPRTFEVNDRVILRSARQFDGQATVWKIIGIDDKNVWLRRQGPTSVLYSTSRTDALEHAQ
jgi:hypothetical protein